MADTELVTLDPGGAMRPDDQFVISRGGIAKRLSGSDIAASAVLLVHAVIDSAGPIALDATHFGQLLPIKNGASSGDISVVLPNDAPVGTVIMFRQLGPAKLLLSAESGGALFNRLTHTRTAGQYATVSISCEANAGGAAAQWFMSGDTAA